MANRAKEMNKRNHKRQRWYLSHGIVMLPTLKRERELRKMLKKIKSAADYADNDTLMPAT